MARNKVEITGFNTRDLPLLSNDEMTILFKKMKDGSKVAREKLIEGNLKLVLSILKRYQNRVDNMDDLFQTGCIGLTKAVDNFDLSYEVKFSTYAVFMIEGDIRRYVRDNNALRISRSVRELAYKVITYKEEFMSNFSTYPTNTQICEDLHISPYELSNAMQCLSEPVSIFEPIYNDGGDTIYLLDQIEDKSNNIGLDDSISIEDAIKKLKDKERDILVKRYVVGDSQTEIAQNMGISQAQVSRLESSALDNVKKLIM